MGDLDGGWRWEVPVVVSALRDRWEGVLLGLHRGVVGREENLEIR